MTPLDRLKLSVALTHGLPGTETRLRTDGGDDIVISRHPAADIDPCAMRRIVLAFAEPGHLDLSEHIVDIEIGGAAAGLGGGVYATRRDGVDERWIPTLLPPRTVAAALDGITSEMAPADSMAATLKPDRELGVTLLVIS